MKNNTLATISPDTTSDNALDLVLNAIKTDPTLQPSTKKAYTRALNNYAGAGLSLLDPDHLAEYCLTKSDSTKSFLKAGINKLAAAIDCIQFDASKIRRAVEEINRQISG